jgi:carboxylesterase
MSGAAPFFYRGNAVGCLCLHGFTASPAEVSWLGAHLADCGFTVYGPRLAGHGTNPRDLLRMRWEDWYASALDGYQLLQSQCEKVYVVGHSMGGLLALLLASQQPVAGAVVLAAPIRFRHRSTAYARYLKYILRFTDHVDRTSLPDVIRAEQERRGEDVLGRVRYELWATSGVAELYRLSGVVYERLPDVTAPLLVMYSDTDQTVPLENRDLIVSRVKSTVIRTETITDSDHILPQDRQRETVFAHVARFIGAG